MTYEELVAEVQRRGGLESVDEAARAVAVTARVLGECLVPDEAGPLAAVLPEPVAARVRAGVHTHDFDVEEMYDRVARGEGSGRRFGAEHAQVVCQVLAESMPEPLRLRLQRHLGPSYAPLFELRSPSSRPARPLRVSPPVDAGRGSTLATGRPGSSRPLAVGQADRAQAGSIARPPDPHAETKLSSSPGLTQERLDDTLAQGRPGSSATIADTKR
jgi:uncharacterized protein (DUF2267 family)